MFYICCRVWKIETSIGQFMVHFFYNAHSKKKKPLDTGLSDTFSNWQHTILICGEWQGGLSQGVGVIQENGRKRYLKRWKGEEKLCQNTNISLMCLPTHEAIGEWKAWQAVRQGTEGRTFSPHCHLNLSAILHFMSPLSPNIIWLIPRYTNMALLVSFYISTTTN